MRKQVPLSELSNRLENFKNTMNEQIPNWEMAIFLSKVNQYYFTGTMQDGMLMVPREGEAIYWVHRSYERALDESVFPHIKKMDSYREAAGYMKDIPNTVHMETDVVPLSLLKRLQKYFPFQDVRALDAQIAVVRAVKSEYEISLMKESGKIHQKVLERLVPEMLKEGMSEAELATELFSVMIEEGHHGLARFGMFDTEMAMGFVSFGESSNYPIFFNGPGGNIGLSPAMPSMGSRERKLKKGDLVFIDAACGVEGYHTDKTMTYMFGKSFSDEVIKEHQKCVDIQNKVAEMLKPGAIPAQIYEKIMSEIDPEFLTNFMGYGNHQVKFLGHSIGLFVDETPVIAKGFTEPIKEGMVFALEPKKGIAQLGMVGIENTFLVTPEGGECITGNHPGLMLVE